MYRDIINRINNVNYLEQGIKGIFSSYLFLLGYFKYLIFTIIPFNCYRRDHYLQKELEMIVIKKLD